MPLTVKLKTPLTTHEGVKKELELRDMKARDMVKMRVAPFYWISLGDETPTDIQNKRADQRFEIRYDIAMGYLSELTGVDKILLGEMSGPDMREAANTVIVMWTAAQGE